MSKIKYIIALSVAVLATEFYGMRVDQTFTRAEVKTFFIPQDQDQMRNELFSELDRARNKVTIAVYWITENSIIDKLIEIRQRGINVQIIFDESSGNNQQILQQVMNKFLHRQITPIIYPSEGMGKMHNKFLVIDDAITITGSLNFTYTAFDPTSEKFNFENVLVLKSPEVARKYGENFSEIRSHIFEHYVDMIAAGDSTPWFERLVPILRDQNPDFTGIAQSVLQETEGRLERERIEKFFGLQPMARYVVPAHVEPPTQKQIDLLTRKGVYTEGMSKQEASELIGKIIKEEKQASPVQSTPKPAQKKRAVEPPTENQINFLTRKGIYEEGMSKQEASDLIGKIKQQVERVLKTQYAPKTTTKKIKVEPPTQYQIDFLSSRGRYNKGMSYEEAYAEIGRIKQQEKQFGYGFN